MELQFSMERRMLNRLLLETAFLRDTGLFHGQTGIILGFALLYERTSDEIYKEIMDVLLDRMTERLTNDLSINFDKGIAGIGWGMEYLIQNRLVEGDSLEGCKEFDERIVRENVRRMTDISLETGLEGLLHYITALSAGSATILAESQDGGGITAEMHRNTTRGMQVHNITLYGSNDGSSFEEIKANIDLAQSPVEQTFDLPLSTYRYIKAQFNEWDPVNNYNVTVAEFNVGKK